MKATEAGCEVMYFVNTRGGLGLSASIHFSLSPSIKRVVTDPEQVATLLPLDGRVVEVRQQPKQNYKDMWFPIRVCDDEEEVDTEADVIGMALLTNVAQTT